MAEADDLLSSAAGGDVDALSLLLEQSTPLLRKHVSGRIGREWRALLEVDDVIQVTFVEAFLSITQCTARDGPGFSRWLQRIAENNISDAIRELNRLKRPPARKRLQDPADAPCVALVELLAITSSTPSRRARRREACDVVTAALKKLPPDYQRVVRLYDLEGEPVRQVAQALGRSEGAVFMLLARAHERLRQLLIKSKFASANA
jgi:RNA polymerase sigma factor (sigma-70 family)